MKPMHGAAEFHDRHDNTWVAGYVVHSFGDPGRLTGPPEHCYPPEGADIEVLTLALNGHTVPVGVISREMLDEIKDQIEQEASERVQAENDAYADFQRDVNSEMMRESAKELAP